MIGLRSITESAYEKLLMAFGIVKKDSIFCTFRALILPLVRDGDFASFYNLDKGRDSVSPALLSLAVILQRTLGYSDREMARAVRVDLEVKYALGLPVLYPGFHYSLLSIHRSRLIQGGAGRDIFEHVLRLAQEKGLLSKGEDQILDSTHIVADIALPTASGLVRQAITHLLRAIEKHDPSMAEKVASASGTRKYLDKIRKVKPAPGTPREKKECDMTPDEKKALFTEVVREGRALARVCKEEHIQDDSCEEALALLIEILESIAKGDDDNITRTPPKQRRCKIESVHDLDARYAKKTPETGYVGYKAHMAMSAESRFITHTETTPMDVGDPTMAPVVVDGVLSHGLDFSKAMGDTQYGSGKFRRFALSRGVRVSAPLFPKAQSASWTKEGFIYDPEAQTMTCPAGKTTTSKWYSADGEVMVYKFSRKVCRDCPKAKDCIGDKDYMSASVSVYHEELEAAAAYSETEAFRLDKAIRARIEAKFAETKRFHGMARAIYRGLQKVDLQVRLTAIALNIKRIFTLLQEPKASTLAEPEAA